MPRRRYPVRWNCARSPSPPNPKLDFRRAFRVEHGVFHQVNQHLFDQRRIHRHHQQFVRHADANRQRVEPLLNLPIFRPLRGDFLRMACGTLSICTAPSLNRVMDSMFSTSRTSHCASSRTWPIKLFHFVAELVVVFQHGGGREPMIEVSGVRRSCDTERSRFAFIFSLLRFDFTRSCRFT